MSDLTYIDGNHYINFRRVIQAADEVHGMLVFHTVNGCENTREYDFGMQHDKVYFLDENNKILFYVQSTASFSGGILSLQSVVRLEVD